MAIKELEVTEAVWVATALLTYEKYIDNNQIQKTFSIPLDYNQLKEDNMLKRLHEYAVRINR